MISNRKEPSALETLLPSIEDTLEMHKVLTSGGLLKENRGRVSNNRIEGVGGE